MEQSCKLEQIWKLELSCKLEISWKLEVGIKLKVGSKLEVFTRIVRVLFSKELETITELAARLIQRDERLDTSIFK